MQVDWIDPGYYKIRARAKGHWIPIFVYFEDGERDPETWELLSDQRLAALWSPSTCDNRLWPANPAQFINRAHPIEKGEFEWLMALRGCSPQILRQQLLR